MMTVVHGGNEEDQNSDSPVRAEGRDQSQELLGGVHRRECLVLYLGNGW